MRGHLARSPCRPPSPQCEGRNRAWKQETRAQCGPGSCVALDRSLSCSVPLPPCWLLALSRAPPLPYLGLAPALGVQEALWARAEQYTQYLPLLSCVQRGGPGGPCGQEGVLRLCGPRRGQLPLPPSPSCLSIGQPARSPGPRVRFCISRATCDSRGAQSCAHRSEEFPELQKPWPALASAASVQGGPWPDCHPPPGLRLPASCLSSPPSPKSQGWPWA